jgi:hypothetical protein
MNVGATFIPDAQPPILEEPRNGPLDDPAMHAQATAMGRATPGQQRENATPMQLPPARLSKGFRPGFRKRLFFTGSRGSIKFHSRSSNNRRAISSSLSLSSREGVNHVARY